jgi:hypothetical protein
MRMKDYLAAANEFQLGRGTNIQSDSKIRQAASFALQELHSLRSANAPTASLREELHRISDQMQRCYNCELIMRGATFAIRACNNRDVYDVVTDFFHYRH